MILYDLLSEGRMKATIRISVILSMVIILAACTTKPAELPAIEQYSDDQLALQALVSFLDNLHNGSYEEAAELYGGSYEIMMDHNPSIDPEKHVALLKNACTINGAACLEVKSAGLDRPVSAAEFLFKVDFLKDDGTLFVLGPCCGGNETDTPPQSLFIFRVIKDSNGKFLVMDMPPYMP